MSHMWTRQLERVSHIDNRALWVYYWWMADDFGVRFKTKFTITRLITYWKPILVTMYPINDLLSYWFKYHHNQTFILQNTSKLEAVNVSKTICDYGLWWLGTDRFYPYTSRLFYWCKVRFGTGRFYPHPSGLFRWYWGNNLIALMPVKQPGAPVTNMV